MPDSTNPILPLTAGHGSAAAPKDPAMGMSAWPIIGLILGIVAVGAGLTARAAWWADEKESQVTQDHAPGVLDHLLGELGVQVKDYAWWDEAYLALHVKASRDWAMENLIEGSVIGPDRSVDGVLVLDPADDLLYGLWQGRILDTDEAKRMADGLIALADRARSAMHDVPAPVGGIVSLDGTVALAAAAALGPIDPALGEAAPPGRTVIVFARSLSPEYVDRIGGLYGLPHARISEATCAPNCVALSGADGSVLGYLAWSPLRPGTDLLRSMWLEALIAIAALGGIGGIVLRQFMAQRRMVHAQGRMIDDGVARLNDSLSKLSNALQAVDYGIAMYDREAKLQHWNDAYERLWSLPPGMARQGVAAKDILDYCFNVVGFQLQETDDFGKPASDPYRLERTGRWVYHCANGRILAARRLPLSDGGYLAVSSDATQQAKHEQELVAAREQAVLANRSKSEFLANVSHELRTPLNAIIGFSEILSRELFGPLGSDRYKSYVADIHSSGEHLLSLINDILDLSKIESGRSKLRLEVFDCVELCQSVARLIRPRSLESLQELNLETPDGPIGLNADKRALKQVLINLLSNAVKFTPEGGKIVLSCRPKKGGVEFAVADTGIGIDEKDIETALAPFGQIDSNYSRRHEGTGLGLPIVNGIVALHNGTLKVDSRVGVGTTVTIFVPDQGIVGGAAEPPSAQDLVSRTAAS